MPRYGVAAPDMGGHGADEEWMRTNRLHVHPHQYHARACRQCNIDCLALTDSYYHGNGADGHSDGATNVLRFPCPFACLSPEPLRSDAHMTLPSTAMHDGRVDMYAACMSGERSWTCSEMRSKMDAYLVGRLNSRSYLSAGGGGMALGAPARWDCRAKAGKPAILVTLSIVAVGALDEGRMGMSKKGTDAVLAIAIRIFSAPCHPSAHGK